MVEKISLNVNEKLREVYVSFLLLHYPGSIDIETGTQAHIKVLMTINLDSDLELTNLPIQRLKD